MTSCKSPPTSTCPGAWGLDGDETACEAGAAEPSPLVALSAALLTAVANADGALGPPDWLEIVACPMVEPTGAALLGATPPPGVLASAAAGKPIVVAAVGACPPSVGPRLAVFEVELPLPRAGLDPNSCEAI